MKLLLFLSHNGVASRRKSFDLIKQGKVKVNRKIVREPSTLIDAQEDFIEVSGKSVTQEHYIYVLLNKPQDCVTTTTNKHDQTTVMDILPLEFSHLKPVGRLDKDTEGLLLFTNDGDLAYQLTHPKFELDKVYQVVVKGLLSLKSIKTLENGVIIDGKRTSKAKITNVKTTKDKTKFTMTIHEGKKRQIRRMCAAVDHAVVFLKRMQQGTLKLGTLKPGQWRLLRDMEVKKLKGLLTKSKT